MIQGGGYHTCSVAQEYNIPVIGPCASDLPPSHFLCRALSGPPSGARVLSSRFEHCDAVAVGGRQRWHFHSFMLDVHKQLHDARKGSAKYSSDAGEALATVADRVTAAGRLLCFDEFQVTDIADAMILKGLFERLWDRGVVVITTSNRVPARLYEGGLNRSHFLPFVDSLQQRCEVLELRGSQDYRRAVAAESGLFFSPLSADNAAAIQTVFDGLARASAEPPRALTVASGPRLTRSIAVPWAHPGGEGCWFTFEELCGSATGASDFGALAQRFDVIVVSGIPRLSSRQSNEARRMITLIDAAYEHGVRLICSAAAPIDELFEALALDVVTTDEDDDVSRAPSTSVNARAGSDRGDGSTASSPSAAPVREIHLAVSGEGGSSGRSTTYIDGGKTEWSATGRMEVSMSELSSVNEVAFAFARGASRLHEMQGKGFTRRRKHW